MKKISIQIWAWGSLPGQGKDAEAVIHIATANPLPNGKFPLVIQNHGIGGAYYDQEGAPAVVTERGRLWGIHPRTKKEVDFCLICIRDGFSMTPDRLPYIKKHFEATYPGLIDWDRVILAGLSAGANTALQAIQNPVYAPFIKLAVIMSQTAPIGTVEDLKPLVNNKIKTVFSVGTMDPDANLAAKASTVANQALPGSSKFVPYPGRGHERFVWADTMDPLSKFPELGGQSVYSLALQDLAEEVPAPAPIPTPLDPGGPVDPEPVAVTVAQFDVKGYGKFILSDNGTKFWELYPSDL